MANKRRTRTRTKFSTFGTELGSVVRSDFNNFNSLSFSLVLDETLQLEETPIANPIIHSPSSSDISDSFEVFHNNLASVKIAHNFLADVVINCSHKPILLSRQLLEKPSGTSSAFTLQFTSQEFELPFNLFDLGRMEKFVVRSNSEIIDPQVHTENSVRTRTHGAFLGECKHKKTFTFRINSQKAFINFPTEIIFETVWNSKGNFNPSFDCGDAQDIILERETSRRVVSDGTEFDNGFALSFLNKSAGLFDTGDSKLRWQSHFSQIFINERMKFNVISDFHSPSNINAHLYSFFINRNSFNNFLSWFNSNLSSCSGSHGLLRDSDYLNSSEGIFPPKPEGMGIQNARFI